MVPLCENIFMSFRIERSEEKNLSSVENNFLKIFPFGRNDKERGLPHTTEFKPGIADKFNDAGQA